MSPYEGRLSSHYLGKVMAGILVFSCLATVVGLFDSTLFTPLWPSLLVGQLAYLAGFNVAVFGLCFGLARAIRGGSIPLLVGTFSVLGVLATGLSAATSVVIVLGGAFLIGAAISLATSDDRDSGFAFVIATGLGVIAAVLTLAARMHMNFPGFYTTLSIVPYGLLLFRDLRSHAMKSIVARLSSLARPTSPSSDIVHDIGFCVLLVVLQIHLLYVLLPERYSDALVVHLYVPSFISGHGRWLFDVNTWAFAHTPLTVDFLYSFFFSLGGETGVRVYNFCAFLLICSIVNFTTARLSNARVAVWTVVLFATTPLTLIENASLFIENTLTLWITAAASIVVLAWRRLGLSQSISVLVLLSASSMSKLHGLLAAAIIGGCLVIGFARTGPNLGTWRWFVLAAMVAALFGSVPYVHAWIDTGNPVFPFFNQLFRSPYWPPEAFVDARWTGRFNWRLLWDATFISTNFMECYNGTLGLGMVLLIPLGIAVAVVRHKSADVLLAVIAFGLVILIGTQIQYLRYFYLAFPLLFVNIGRAIGVASKFNISRHLAAATVAASVLFNVYLMPAAAWILPESDFRAVYDSAIRRNLEIVEAPERIANLLINQLGGPNTRVMYTGSPFAGLLMGVALSTEWYGTAFSEEASGVTTLEQARALINRMEPDYVVHSVEESNAMEKAIGSYLSQNGREVGRIGKLIIYAMKS
jgi:hypothetical protein